MKILKKVERILPFMSNACRKYSENEFFKNPLFMIKKWWNYFGYQVGLAIFNVFHVSDMDGSKNNLTFYMLEYIIEKNQKSSGLSIFREFVRGENKQ